MMTTGDADLLRCPFLYPIQSRPWPMTMPKLMFGLGEAEAKDQRRLH